MVESIGARPVTSETKVTRVVQAQPVPKVAGMAVPDGDTTALGGVAKALASKPPVDVDRVALVRRAIERGDFPILPATIADRMIALKYDWMSADDQA
ncbi:flagellar biosynthesis anti-sigma factor FlgM [Sphingomonas sp.]|uniref:flagellar biosynthesis anti-sigma factor FlgM n=1 Tax=Sphingomonas sp. TaxID=28214 RepID=UPI0035BBAEF5